IRDHDSHLIPSSNSFDLSGIFSRTDQHVKKEEPTDDDKIDLHDVPLAPSTASSHLLPVKDKEGNGAVALSNIPKLPEAVLNALHTLDALEADAKKAFRDKQTISFLEVLAKIRPYYRLPHSQREDPQIPSSVRDRARGMYTSLDNEWHTRDKKDMVHITAVLSPPPVLEFASDENQWNPSHHPRLLPEDLKTEAALQPESTSDGTRSWFRVQKLVDFGHACISKATTLSVPAKSNAMIVTGYQLLLIAAAINLEKVSSEKLKFNYLLYLIRDAQYARQDGYVKDRLKAFNEYLTALGKSYGVGSLQVESNWQTTGGIRKRQRELDSRARQRQLRLQRELAATSLLSALQEQNN
ncbi:hypothetical protein H0H93_007023, partial [Arthromyces matolae]